MERARKVYMEGVKALKEQEASSIGVPKHNRIANQYSEHELVGNVDCVQSAVMA